MTPAGAARPLRRLAAALALVALLPLLAEGGARVAAALGLAPRARPADGGGYWRGDHPDFGVWREPGARFRHVSDCFDVEYRTNSLGARDRERREDVPGHRVIVLGDSFFAGWGVREAERLSNRLEAATGVEHANFAMAHFGPYQSLLVYERLASHLSHDAVMISVVPVNDFGDIDLELARGLDGYEHRFRPYLVGDPPDLRHFDYREPRLRRVLRQHSYLWNLLAGARAAAVYEIAQPGAPRRASWFYDFRDDQAARLEEILRRLADAAGGRALAVVLVPALPDLRRFEAAAGNTPPSTAGADPLAARLSALGREVGFRVVDLLPAMAERARPRDWQRYFHACDYHWSAYGHEVAAGIVLSELRDAYYDPGGAAPGPDRALGVTPPPSPPVEEQAPQ